MYLSWSSVGSDPAGDLYFHHFEFFARSPFRTAQRGHANEIKHNHSHVIIVVLTFRPQIIVSTECQLLMTPHSGFLEGQRCRKVSDMPAKLVKFARVWQKLLKYWSECLTGKFEEPNNHWPWNDHWSLEGNWNISSWTSSSFTVPGSNQNH